MNRLFLALVVLCSVSSCSQREVKWVPFEREVPEAGVARGEFTVAENQLYSVELNYKFTPTPGDRERVWRLSGGTDVGAPFTVRSRVTGLAGEPYEVEAARPKLTSWSAESLSAELARVELSPGRYVIDVRLIDGRLPSGVTATFSVRRAYTGK